MRCGLIPNLETSRFEMFVQTVAKNTRKASIDSFQITNIGSKLPGDIKAVFQKDWDDVT